MGDSRGNAEETGRNQTEVKVQDQQKRQGEMKQDLAWGMVVAGTLTLIIAQQTTSVVTAIMTAITAVTASLTR
jgi:hypothetical protein